MTHQLFNKAFQKLFFLQIIFTAFIMVSCNNNTPAGEAPVTVTEDSTEIQAKDFSPDTSQLGNKEKLADIMFSGTIKEMGVPTKDVTILVYNSTGGELTSGNLKSDELGKYSFPKTEATFPVKVVADFGDSYFLEVFVLKSPAATDTTIDFSLSKYGTNENEEEHYLNVSLKSGTNGVPLAYKRVLFDTDIEDNTWSDNTNADGVANFTHLAKAASVCDIYTGKSVFNFTFKMGGITRKAHINTSITLAK